MSRLLTKEEWIDGGLGTYFDEYTGVRRTRTIGLFGPIEFSDDDDPDPLCVSFGSWSTTGKFSGFWTFLETLISLIVIIIQLSPFVIIPVFTIWLLIASS